MLLLKGGLVKTITHADIRNGDVLVGDDGKIVAVGKNVKAPKGAEVMDCKGLLVAPGFIDAHTHIGLHGEAVRWEGVDINEYSDPVTPEMRGIDAINPRDEAFDIALSGGVTTAVTGPGSANVIGGTFAAIHLKGRTVEEMIIKNPAAMKIAFGENPKGCYGQSGRKAPITRMMVAGLLRKTLADTREYLRKIEAAEKDPSKDRPFDMKLEAMLPVLRGEIPLKAHAHRADDILTSIRIAQEFGVGLTLDHCTEGHLIADVLAQYDYPALVGPSFGNKSKHELKEKTFETPGILERAGLLVCIITDAPVTPLNHLPLCAGLAVRAGMSEKGAWKAITINPAKVFGLDKRIGSLEPGKDADISIFDGDPLRDIQCRARRVLIGGKTVYAE